MTKQFRPGVCLTLALVVSLAATGLSCAKNSPPNKRNDGIQRVALLVGIDHYGASYTPNVPARQQWKALAGTVNDTRLLGKALKAQGFQVNYLHNQDATRDGILSALKSTFMDRAKKSSNDILYFHFSGHGKRIRDDDGDEADRLDESLIPYDNLGEQNGKNNLRDDALGELLDKIAAESPNLVVTLDTCFSGSATRGGEDPENEAQITKRGSRFSEAVDCSAGCGADDGVMEHQKGKRVPYVVLSATRYNQEANELIVKNGQKMGAFTYEWVEVLKSLRPNTSFREVHKLLTQRMLKYDKQNPHVEGRIDREVLGPGFVDSRNIVVVYDGKTLKTNKGGVFNMVRGSTFGIYPKDNRPQDWSNPPITAVVTKYTLSDSSGKITKGSSKDIDLLKKLGGVARLLTIGKKGFRLKLDLSAAPAHVREAFKENPDIVLVDPGTPDSYSIIGDASEVRILDSFGTTQLIPQFNNKPPFESARLPQQLKNLGWAIDRLVRVERVRFLNKKGEAGNHVDIKILNGPDTPAKRGHSSEYVQDAGQQFTVQIKNQGKRPLIAHLGIFDSDGMVTILTQRKADSESGEASCEEDSLPIKPGQTVTFPRCQGQNYFWGRDVPGLNELFVVFTAKPLDHFSSLGLSFKAKSQTRGGGKNSGGATKLSWGATSLKVRTSPVEDNDPF